VQQPDRLTSDLHRPDTTRWPAPVTFIDLHATSYGSEGLLDAARAVHPVKIAVVDAGEFESPPSRARDDIQRPRCPLLGHGLPPCTSSATWRAAAGQARRLHTLFV
jgi:hypothetical protein